MFYEFLSLYVRSHPVCNENTTNYDLVPVPFPCSSPALALSPAFVLSRVKVWAGRWRAISPSQTAAELHPAAPGSSHAPPASLPSPSVRPTPATAAQPHGTPALVWMWHVNMSLCESLTSMISRISHWFSRASSFSWALPTTLSVLKRPLHTHTHTHRLLESDKTDLLTILPIENEAYF